jgi:hypothetical protein
MVIRMRKAFQETLQPLSKALGEILFSEKRRKNFSAGSNNKKFIVKTFSLFFLFKLPSCVLKKERIWKFPFN